MGEKISELGAAGSLTGSELIETVQGGNSRRTTTQDIANLGGGASYLVYTTELDDTQIKNLATPTPVLVMPVPSAGKLNIAINITYITNFTAAYTGGDQEADYILFMYGSSQFSVVSDSTIAFIYNTGNGSYLSNLLISTGVRVGQANCQSLSFETGYDVFPNYTNSPVAQYQEGMYITAFQSTEVPFGGGNALNTLKIIVTYIEIDL